MTFCLDFHHYCKPAVSFSLPKGRKLTRANAPMREPDRSARTRALGGAAGIQIFLFRYSLFASS
ncbi:MAG: hypothetical protein PHN61_00205 [Methanothrix sp.]|nr:hypothetical protein [Methanothrix sp.]